MLRKGDGCPSRDNWFRSWGEKQIALLLERNGIEYQYEYPVAVVDDGKTRINYPDFRLPKYNIIVEYFGVNGNCGYDQKAHHKMEVYRREGIDAIFLTRDSLRGDWPTAVMNQIEDVLRNRVRSFYDRKTLK